MHSISLNSVPKDFPFINEDILVRIIDISREMTGADEIFEIGVNFVDSQTMSGINHQLRSKDTPTNVISLNYEEGGDGVLLGDIFVCSDVIMAEAAQQDKDIELHLIHLLCHSVLHLLGFDHLEDDGRVEMEKIEVEMLRKIGFDRNPYE